jgi:hypothetical protein
MPGEEEKRCCVLVDRATKRVSILPASFLKVARMPTAIMKFDETKTEIIAEDWPEEDAKRYARLNMKDKFMASVAQAREARERGAYPYAQMPQAEYDALFHRMTKEEYEAKRGAVIEQEEAAEAAKRAAQKADVEDRAKDCSGLKILFLYGCARASAHPEPVLLLLSLSAPQLTQLLPSCPLTAPSCSLRPHRRHVEAALRTRADCRAARDVPQRHDRHPRGLPPTDRAQAPRVHRGQPPEPVQPVEVRTAAPPAARTRPRAAVIACAHAHPHLRVRPRRSNTPLYCYAYHETPPTADDDFTIQTCKAQDGLRYAKPALADMDAACARVAEHMIAAGGYHAVMGFSCGGEIVAHLIGKLAEVNAKARIPTTMVALFGVRCLYKKYGSPLEGPLPAGLKAIHVHGSKDDEDAFQDDILADQAEFESRFKAAGVEMQKVIFDGGHAMPKLTLMHDTVYLPMKRFFNWSPGESAATGSS